MLLSSGVLWKLKRAVLVLVLVVGCACVNNTKTKERRRLGLAGLEGKWDGMG